MSAQPSPHGRPDSRNVILASADMLVGREIDLFAGQRLKLGGDTVWFPLSALVRIEVGSSGIIGGWANDTNTVGLAECLHAVEDVDPWVVAVSGTAVAVPSVLIRNLFGQSSAFSGAAMLGLHNMACDARQIAASHVTDRAQVKIGKLLVRLDQATAANERVAVNQAEIGRWLGLQRTTVCAAMKEMKRNKLISYARTHVAILDREALAHPVV